jgi:hypothetical protein
MGAGTTGGAVREGTKEEIERGLHTLLELNVEDWAGEEDTQDVAPVHQHHIAQPEHYEPEPEPEQEEEEAVHEQQYSQPNSYEPRGNVRILSYADRMSQQQSSQPHTSHHQNVVHPIHSHVSAPATAPLPQQHSTSSNGQNANKGYEIEEALRVNAWQQRSRSNSGARQPQQILRRPNPPPAPAPAPAPVTAPAPIPAPLPVAAVAAPASAEHVSAAMHSHAPLHPQHHVHPHGQRAVDGHSVHATRGPIGAALSSSSSSALKDSNFGNRYVFRFHSFFIISHSILFSKIDYSSLLFLIWLVQYD